MILLYCDICWQDNDLNPLNVPWIRGCLLYIFVCVFVESHSCPLSLFPLKAMSSYLYIVKYEFPLVIQAFLKTDNISGWVNLSVMGRGGPETKYCAVFKPKYIFPHEINVICFRQISGHKDRKRDREICKCGHVTPNDLFDYIVRPSLVSIAFLFLFMLNIVLLLQC